MKKNYLILLFVIIGIQVNAQSTFQATFGGASLDYGYSVQQTTDGGYIMAGYSSSFGSYDLYLVKVASDASLEWSKTFGGTAADLGNSVQQTNDGGYIITGYITGIGAGLSDVYLVKTTPDGTVEWTKTFGGTKDDQGNSVRQTSDGGYIITGSTQSFGQGSSDVYLLKTASDGSLQWTKTYGGIGSDYGYFVRQTTDGGFIITGATASYGPSGGFGNVYLLKTLSDGTLEWGKSFGGTSSDYGNCVQQTTDGGYIIAGSTQTYGAGGFDAYLIKTTSNGTYSWSKTYGGAASDEAYAVVQTADGGYTVAGYAASYTPFMPRVYLVRATSNGTYSWSKIYGGTGDDRGYSLQQTTDGGYVIAGYTSSFGAAGGHLYLIKTDDTGATGCNEINPATPTGGTGATLNSGGVTNSGGIESSGGTSNTPATLTSILCFTVLPIELLSFDGENKGAVNILKWQTASENNNDYFTIERDRGQGTNEWEAIGKVTGATNSNVERNYSFIDEKPFSRISFYRLKPVDYDGKFTYSQTISITTNDKRQTIKIYPVPSNKELNYEFYSEGNSLINISVIDLLGNIVTQEHTKSKQGINKSKLNINNLSQGMYFLKIENGTKQSQIKFIKQ